jgi:excinuclease ABC subunit C
LDKEKLKRILALMPSGPGVYLMKNRVDEIIYIGKAVSLKKRVRSYFNRKHENNRTAIMVSAIENIEFIVTGNEIEALILENNLIKKHKPRYNILLKDSKTHPYVRVTMKEKFPRIEKVRRVGFKDGNLYFGPFPNAYDLNRILEMLSRTYRLCTSKKKLNSNKKNRPCLKYHLGLCQGVCQGLVSEEKYRRSVMEAVEVLAGKKMPDYTALKTQLEQLVTEYRYEEAAEVRDIISALQRFFETQKVEFVKPVDADIWGISKAFEQVVFSIFFIRSGKLLGNRIINSDSEPASELQEILSSVMTRFYDSNLIPPSIFIGSLPASCESLAGVLSEKIGRKVRISVPSRGQFRQLQKMADLNALEILKNLKATKNDRLDEAVIDLQNSLKLKKTPVRIECIDISHIQGVDPVASLVVFENARPKKSEYRLFHIKETQGGDDPASIGEVVGRRIRRLLEENLSLPDLLIVDGGITQVRAAERQIARFGVKLACFGLAKREELLVTSDGTEIDLPFSSPGMKMVIKLRNEAHRFANSFQKKTHYRKLVKSSLLNLPGVGPATLRKVIWGFGSTEKAGQATLEELQKIAGIPLKTAKIIYEALKND